MGKEVEALEELVELEGSSIHSRRERGLGSRVPSPMQAKASGAGQGYHQVDLDCVCVCV